MQGKACSNNFLVFSKTQSPAIQQGFVFEDMLIDKIAILKCMKHYLLTVLKPTPQKQFIPIKSGRCKSLPAGI
jgi:hypothetical protein